MTLLEFVNTHKHVVVYVSNQCSTWKLVISDDCGWCGWCGPCYLDGLEGKITRDHKSCCWKWDGVGNHIDEFGNVVKRVVAHIDPILWEEISVLTNQ